VLLGGAALGLAITAAAGASPGFWWLVAVLALARPLLSAVNAVAGVVAAEETRSADRAAAIAVIGAAYAAGTGIVSIVRAATEGLLTFRGLLALALLPLLALPLLARVVRESPHFDAAAARRREQRLGAVRSDLWRPLLVVCALHAAVGLVLGPVYTYLFIYGERVVGVSPAVMAGLVVAAGPAGLAGLLLGRWVADRAGRRPAAGTAMALAAGAAMLAYAGGPLLLGAGYLGTIALGAAYTPAAGALDAELFPTSDRATAAGWISAAQIIGQVAGLAGFGILADALGGFTPAAIALWAPVPVVALLYARLPETLGRELDAEA
jgi:MFS family permease